ncbi:hypothetical protein [Aquiflexum lacus]|uniref:hypothetical protein n=1 Tax=Aquiflexum lacus TaxID=2483805 RepID=UPI00189385F6|nr:hypothetical protein [Aquiflexum lacus]
MKSKKVFGLLLILTIFIYAFTCEEVYEDNSFITFQGKITDEFNQNISGLDLIFGQEISDYWYSRSEQDRFEYDSLENALSRRISLGKTDGSGNFKFLHPEKKITRFFVYTDTNKLFRYLERGTLVERNYISFEWDQETGQYAKTIKNIQIVNP